MVYWVPAGEGWMKVTVFAAAFGAATARMPTIDRLAAVSVGVSGSSCTPVYRFIQDCSALSALFASPSISS